MRKTLLLGVFLAFSGLVAFGQARKVTGRVVDAEGKPIPGASVVVRGTKIGTTTDANGNYSLNVPENAKALVVSSTGFDVSDLSLAGKTEANVQLKVSDRSMDEVVVVGYQARKKKEEAGAVSRIREQDIELKPNLSVDRALQGQAPGVLVQANNGIPGGAINVRIRGAGSFLAGNQPLYIVDGVQFNNSISGNFTQNNPLAFLNPNDIASIDVLKDAASAAIYGAQAGNGVVIITTKKGKAGKTKFNLNMMTGVTAPLKKFDVLTSQEYVNARAEADFNRWSPQARSAGVAYPFLESQRWALGELSAATGASYGAVTSLFNQRQVDSMIASLRNVDWQDETIRNGIVNNVDLSMSGGNDKTTYYIGANYTKQSTIFDKVDFTRYALLTDITQKINNKLTATVKLNLSSFEQKIPFATDGSFLGSPQFASPLILPVNPVFNDNGTFFGLPPNQALSGILNQNIIAVNTYNSGFQRTNQAVGSFTLDYKVLPWLSYRGFVSMDYRLVQGKQYRDPRTNDGFGVRGRGTVQSNWNTNILTTHTLNWVKAINEQFKLDGLVGYEYRRDYNEGISAAGIGFPSFQFVTINSAATPEAVGEFFTGFKRSGVFGRINANYDDRFILSLIARRDGSSRFGENSRFGNFGSALASWNLDREAFLKNSQVISTLRLRASFGTTGVDAIGNFDALSLYTSGAQYNGAAGINYGGLPNANLSWERNQEFNVGLDYGLFQNRISGSLDFFNRNRKDVLLSRPVSWINGTGSFTENSGVINVKGIEAGINIDVIRPKGNGGFSWTTNFNFTWLYNEIKELYGGNTILPGDPSVKVGRSFGSVFTQQYAGVNPATGRPMFVDTFNNVTYIPQLRDRRYIGDTEPDYFGGFTNTFRFKGFELYALMTYEYGRLATDGQVNFMLENANRTFNTLQFAYDNRWKQPGDITSYPRIFDTGTEPGGVNHVTGSSRLWRKADYIRLRDIRLSYNFPTSVLQKLKLTAAQFYVQGQNLFTYSDWWGYDPEFVGTTTGIIPQTKNYNVGLQIGF